MLKILKIVSNPESYQLVFLFFSLFDKWNQHTGDFALVLNMGCSDVGAMKRRSPGQKEESFKCFIFFTNITSKVVFGNMDKRHKKVNRSSAGGSTKDQTANNVLNWHASDTIRQI